MKYIPRPKKRIPEPYWHWDDCSEYIRRKYRITPTFKMEETPGNQRIYALFLKEFAENDELIMETETL